MLFAVATRALSAPTSRHLVARLHHIDVKTAVMLDTWPKMMRLAYPGVPYQLNKSDQMAILPGGSEIWFSGLDDAERVEKVLGKEFASIYLNECSQIAFPTVTTLRTRLAQNVVRSDGRQLPLRAYYDLNPVGRGHWTHKEFIEGVDPAKPGVKIDMSVRGFAVMNPQDNPHLPAETLEELDALPERQRQRFFLGKYLSEVPGALWRLDEIEALRVSVAPALSRVVVAIDPSGSDGTGGDQQGIMAMGKGLDGHGYLLADRTCRLGPEGWARIGVEAYDEFKADALLAEVNYGGAMVESTIRTADPHGRVNYKAVNASRGKHVRAEPVAALYATVRDNDKKVIRTGRIHHVGPFPELEEELGMFTTAGYQGSGSPNRADALVWAATELMLSDGAAEAWLEYMRRQSERAKGDG